MKLRVAHYDIAADPARAEYNEHCIHVFWHENISVVLPQWCRCPLTILVSQHRDAEWLCHISDMFGYGIVRGSSTRGGSAAIRQLKQRSSHTSFAITPDGPIGPRRNMALGPIFLASRLGMPMVPVGIGFDRPYRLKTWDKFAIPRMFTHCRVVFGPKVHIPRQAKRNQLESYRRGTARLLNELTKTAESWAESKLRAVGDSTFQRVRRCADLELPAPGVESPGSSLSLNEAA